MRLSRLPGDCTRVARSVAVLGDGADLPGIAQHAGLDEAAAAAAVGALFRAEVLADRQPLGFVHPLVEEAVYRDLPAGERELKHQRAVHILRAAGAPPEQLAAHLLQVPRRGDATAVDVLREAAARAAARGAAEGRSATWSARSPSRWTRPCARTCCWRSAGWPRWSTARRR